jgi:hypothetical protein
MNLSRINEIRAAAGLPALTATKTSAEARKRNERNRRERAAANRELKAARQRKGK